MLRSYLSWYFIALIVGHAIDVCHWGRGYETGDTAIRFQGVVGVIFLSLWIRQEARRRLPGFPTDGGLILTLIYLPLFLVTARGARGVGVWVMIVVASWAVAMVAYFAKISLSGW